jgi:hypothetical protein
MFRPIGFLHFYAIGIFWKPFFMAFSMKVKVKSESIVKCRWQWVTFDLRWDLAQDKISEEINSRLRGQSASRFRATREVWSIIFC